MTVELMVIREDASVDVPWPLQSFYPPCLFEGDTLRPVGRSMAVLLLDKKLVIVYGNNKWKGVKCGRAESVSVH